MIGELGQSHMLIVGPGSDDEDDADAPKQDAPPADTDLSGDPGLTVRVIDGKPTITRVRAGSSADQAGLAAGFVVTQIAGRPLGPPAR